MDKRKAKRRSFRCTDEEWDLITKNAELAFMNVTDYIITKTVQGDNPLVLTIEQQKQILRNVGKENYNPLVLNDSQQRALQNGVILISHYIKERYKKDGMTEEEFMEIIGVNS